MLLVLAAGATAVILEGSFLDAPEKIFLFLIGLYLTGGSANALNQCFEREIDGIMTRTNKRRPLPRGNLIFREALIFSIVIGLAGVILLGYIFNQLTAFLALGTILFYSLFYTLTLKPRTSQNIVIGGLAGAMAPVGAWTAATGTLTATPGLLFLLIFLWTPPHFWSLAIYFKDDYRAAKLPMLPAVMGDRAALNRILLYSILTVAASLLILITNFGWIYLTTAIIMGSLFLKTVIEARLKKDMNSLKVVFRFSIVYLFSLFLALIVDKVS
jgi:protoheme IX farnesyltransferase